MSEVVNESCVEEWESAKPKVRCPVAFAFTDYFGQLATSASSLVVSVDETSENAIARGTTTGAVDGIAVFEALTVATLPGSPVNLTIASDGFAPAELHILVRDCVPGESAEAASDSFRLENRRGRVAPPPRVAGSSTTTRSASSAPRAPTTRSPAGSA